MKLLLIDGHYYVYRSFFAIPNLSNSKGEQTNAIFGFTKTLRLMVKHLQPQLGAVFWDEGMPNAESSSSLLTRRRVRKCPSQWSRSSILSRNSRPCWVSKIFPSPTQRPTT